MLKRILGILSLFFGSVLTVWMVVMVVLAVPKNFEAEAKGLALLVELIAEHKLRSYFLLLSVGLSLIFTAVPLFLAPRKKKVAVSDEDFARLREDEAADAFGAENGVRSLDADSSESADLICVFRSRVMATSFCNPGGRNRQWILREAKVGDVVTCRSVGKSFYDEVDTVGIFSVKGELMGLMDTSLFYTICKQYPNHRMGIIVERISGGRGIPYDCHIRVSIYRN